MEPEGISLPEIDEHRLMPWNDLRRGSCCGRFKSVSDGLYCKICDLFIHKECSEPSESIEHPSHPAHALVLQLRPLLTHGCNACRNVIMTNLLYRCSACNFDVDLCCAKYPPPEVVDVSKTHNHKLTLRKEKIEFQCSASTCIQKRGDRVSYNCDECDLDFHVRCVWTPPDESHPYVPASEVNHSYHSLHSLKLLTASSLPAYSDGKCRLCGREVDEFFYHCSACNFTLDMCCVLNPPPHSLLDLKTHDHQLTLLPRLLSFVCNVCGLSGDRSPYVCLQCDFMIHQDCLGLPRLININRHDHRVSRVPLLGVVNSVCGVCRQKVDWTCGGYSCKKCPPGYVVHSKCATRDDVWNGEELDGVPEETEDIEPYVVIDENTIRHFSHEEHHLRFQVGGYQYEENKQCKACIQPISLQSFYECMDCDFLLHKGCAELPKRKRHVLHNERLTLVTSEAELFRCGACRRFNNGFKYTHVYKKLDVICSSISEPFFHPSHPHHPLYYIPAEESGVCNGCKYESSPVLRCVEKDCEFILDFGCATLPQVVKHRVDDHPLLLCYGEKSIDKYWCYICEKKTNPEKWFYTSKDQWATLHTKCVLGDFASLMPGSIIEYGGTSMEVVLNKRASRPCCWQCKLRCIYPIILKIYGTSDMYVCSWSCTYDL